MDEARRRKVKYLQLCTFRPGSYEKRFVRDMASRPEDELLTIKQAHYIDLLYWVYRQQIAAMRGDDKPEVYRPGELMVDRAIETEKPNWREQRRQDKAEAARARINDWNAKTRKFNRNAEE